MKKDHTKVEMTTKVSCDFCSAAGKGMLATYDGVVRGGSWAYMCDTHFKQRGVGLGLGVGQQIVYVEAKP